ncbi:hypothetical protein DNTS_015359 [Danionella cerebrum]|uniref:G-protein coupled receptors family 1 profile domain-containing protein n=1 Tax=Danionella cerebrum TaxID=2873325 RepID=A0A553NWU4_9TELE|nr:hypothetical protein DNTS_015359 [Danionella translucida]
MYSSGNSSSLNHISQPFRIALIVIYSIVFLVGITGLSVMISLLKTNIRSLTTIAFLNLVIAHFIFLLTIPFRIYYYASQTWNLSLEFCKLVSAMVHIHTYIVFTIYTILLTVRFLQFYKIMQRTEFYRRLHALGASAVVWIVILLIMLPLILFQYGHESKSDEKQCFAFGKNVEKQEVYILNVILSLVIIAMSCILACIQVNILHTMIVKYGTSTRSQQEFWIQMKNFSFVVIMMICLVPYHVFRFIYLESNHHLTEINEVFLAITGLTCFDMLTFIGRGMCKLCFI